jgi:hypothetical protein
MTDNKTYTLEYWIESTQFSKEELENHVTRALDKFLGDIDFEIKDHKDNYLILRIDSTENYIDACHDKLEFEREWAFRAKDELGDLLRSNTFPVLAEIELCLRNFINQAMIDVLGFDWWNSFISENIREKVREIETRTGKHQVKLHHPIELTFFEDLIKIVTAKFQSWPDGRVITASDLSELLAACHSIEDIQREIDNRRKVVSFWDDVFSNYFDDKEAWTELKKNIEKQVIPIRNKVMHHRLMRRYELQQLEERRDEVNQVISLAKTELSETESSKALQNIKIALDSLRPQIDPEILKSLQKPLIDPELFKKPLIDPQIFESIRKSFIGPEIIKSLQRPLIDPKLLEILQKPLIDPEILKALQKPLIDPEIFKSLIPRIDLGLYSNLTDVSDSSTSQEEIDNIDKDETDDSDIDETGTDNNTQDNNED